MQNFNKYIFLYFGNSSKEAAILFHVIGLLLITNFPSVISELRSYKCNNASTYADGSTFSSNLNKVLGDLVKNTPQTGFNTSFYGQSPNRIYGLLQCTGNIPEQDCSLCSQEANKSVPQLCGNSIGGRIWLDNCFIRYQNFSFFSKLDTNGTLLEHVNDIGTTNLNAFRRSTLNLLSNLSNKAYNSANKGFAVGSAAYSSIGTVYGLVQCWRDLSITDCKSCLQLATDRIYQCCSMKQGAQALFGSCTVRYEIYPFFYTGLGGTSTSPPAPPPPPPSSAFSGGNSPTVPAQTPLANGASPTSSQSSSSKTLPIVLGIVGGGVVVALIVCLFAIRSKLKSAISCRRVTRAPNEETHENDPEWTLQNRDQIVFTLEALIEATDNFHENKKLGEGGFGPVYKGITRDGKEIAVKKLSIKSGQGKREFMNEVKLVANVRHRNLVKLIGCCAEGPERLLVYEYLPNKSLDNFLFDPEKKRQLDWHKRYNIIMGIARGLLYLHQDSRLRIIHRDIKANNILLDEELNSKIADFGLARLFPEDVTHIQTRAAGTCGYMAPEYAMRGRLSVKADVYSFGVLVLEIVSGRKCSDLKFPQETKSLLEWAWRLYKKGHLLNMIDSAITETCRQEEALRCIHVALLCTQADPVIRPAMSKVIPMITSASVTLDSAAQPAFVKGSESNLAGSTDGSSVSEIHKASSVASTSSPLVPSINDVTITELEAR
eukprot:PITA_33217